MSQTSDDDSVSSQKGVTALFSLQQNPGQFPQEFPAAEGVVAFNAALYDLGKEIQKEIADEKADDERNAEQQDFMALPPPGDVVDDNVFSVGAESQFSESTPRLPGDPVLNLQQKLTTLCSLRDSLKSQILSKGDEFFQWLKGFTTISLQFPGTKMQVYGNHPLVASEPGKSMLVPMLSFYGITTKETIPHIKHKTSMDSITKNILIRVRHLFTTPLEIPEVGVDCPEPSGTNLVWNIRLTLNGNIFTLFTFRIVAMTNINFSPQVSPLSLQNHYMLLCFAVLSKACAKDFNCLCAMPDIDVELFKIIANNPVHLQEFALFVKLFLAALADPQLDSKRSYMITALHNLVANVVDTTRTGETLAYKMLFDGDVSGSGAYTFNSIMGQITELIQTLRPSGMELQVSLCGGRMIYKLGDVLRTRYDVTSAVSSNPVLIACLGGVVNAQALLAEMVKPLNIPSDADLTLTFAGRAGALDPGFIQTLLMFFTLCSQLGVKKITDEFCNARDIFLREPAVIGMSLVGGDFQLSSARSLCDALAFLNEINTRANPLFTQLLDEFLQQFPLGENRLTKSALAEFDFVPKMASGDYIEKISHYIFESGYTTIPIPANIGDIADRISRYSMSTDQGFSSPIKVLFDIFFTLFSIENFTNRAFVTQKINKELKRIATCASILLFHFAELLPTYAAETPHHQEVIKMLQILGQVINYGYNPMFKLLSDQIHNIMTTYASCFIQLLNLYHIGIVFYSREPGLTLPAVGGRTQANLKSLETACMNMIDPAHAPAQAEGLLQGQLQNVITTGIGFLNTIQGNGILAQLLQIKDHVKHEDLSYKARGKFLTSVEAFDLFLREFVPMLVPPSILLTDLEPLLEIFRRPELGLAELMRFQPVVVTKSENLRNPGADPQGLKVTGEYQFGIYVILSIFGVKFKSEWSKISLFTKMLFYQLLSRGSNMHEVCLHLLGVDLTKVDPEKMRLSSENFMKDQTLFEAIQRCGLVLPAPLQSYYGNYKLHHGIDTYINRLLDTREVRHSFIHPFEYDTDEDILLFEFLNSENLRRLMECVAGGEEFQRLLPDGFQPRSYEFLLKRLRDKFSILTKECDEELKSQVAEAIKEIKSKRSAGSAGAAVAAAGPASVLPTIAREIAEVLQVHGGKNTKDIRSEVKIREVDAFINSFVSQLLGAGEVTPEQFNQLISQLISSTNDMCFEGKEDDISKFKELAPEQRIYWLDHLIEMIGFFKSLSMSQSNPDLQELCRQNIIKYSKLLFLLKKYLLPKPEQRGLEWLQLSSEQLKDALDSIFQPLHKPPVSRNRDRGRYRNRGRAASPSRGRAASPNRGRAASPSRGRAASPSRGRAASPGKSRYRSPSRSPQGGGSPKASKPKTRNNRYYKNAHTRKNKHKRKHHRKYRKIISGSKSNNKTKINAKSRTTKSKNVTFKRRRR